MEKQVLGYTFLADTVEGFYGVAFTLIITRDLHSFLGDPGESRTNEKDL